MAGAAHVNLEEHSLEEHNGRSVAALIRDEFPYDVALDIGEAETPALEAVGELRVVDAQQVQYRRIALRSWICIEPGAYLSTLAIGFIGVLSGWAML